MSGQAPSLAEFLDALQSELSHAAANDLRLDRDCQGVAPGEVVPAVRADCIEALIERAHREWKV